MKKDMLWQWITIGVLVSVLTVGSAYGHGEGGGGHDELTEVPFVPNPSVAEFANAKGTALVNLTEGVIQLEDLEGFPFNAEQNRILPVNVTSITDPRLKGHSGELGGTTCAPASTLETGEAVGPWTCHVHSYVVWLAEIENGALAHPIPLGSIYPRTNGTAADRNFSFREGDISGFGANAIIITAEASFGHLPSSAPGHDGHAAITLTPQGPIVLQANLP